MGTELFSQCCDAKPEGEICEQKSGLCSCCKDWTVFEEVEVEE